MQSLDPIAAREAQIIKISHSNQDLLALRQHLKKICSGPAFKSRHRSSQFLNYIVEQSIAGKFDSLKERLIGVELFGRNPSYDTGEDSIVRTTASDVRRRLQQHYGSNGTSCNFRLSLPLGSYIPEITLLDSGDAGLFEEAAAPALAASPDSIFVEQRPNFALLPESLPGNSAVPPNPSDSSPAGQNKNHWRLFGSLLAAALAVAALGIAWNHTIRVTTPPLRVLPWSAFFDSTHPTHLITSDQSLVALQDIAAKEITLSDYANHNYLPELSNLSPEETAYFRRVLAAGSSTANVDLSIVASISALAQANNRAIDVRAARYIGISDLRTDDNFILLGSPRANPWSSLFRDELDFRFEFDKNTQQTILLNAHPGPHESPTYIPTANGSVTGQSFAIIALVQNPNQNGHILLVAGTTGVGTEAAGRMVTDPTRLSNALHECGIRPDGPLKHFELLLRLSAMAGSPINSEVAACHILPDAKTH